MIRTDILRTVLVFATFYGVASVTQAEESVLFFDNFPCQGQFNIRGLGVQAENRTHNWCAKITDVQDNRLMMSWGSTAGQEGSPTNKIWLSYSSDDGVSWTSPQLFADSTPSRYAVNPCSFRYQNGSTNRVFLFYNLFKGGDSSGEEDDRYDIAYQTTDDSGAHWSNPIELNMPFPMTGLQASPIQLKDNTICLPLYYSSAGHDGQWTGTVMLSKDGGGSWTQGGTFQVDAAQGTLEPTIAELSDGSLYCLIRTTTGYQHKTFSADGGLTWTTPRQSQFPSPESCGILDRLNDGKLAFVWNNNTVSGGKTTPRYPLSIAVATDNNGVLSWSKPKMIETTYRDPEYVNARQLSNHGVFQTKAGTILVAANEYEGIRKNAQNVDAQYGDLVMARFDQGWLSSSLSAEKWTERPAEGGGIRLSQDGLLLVSGAEVGSMTRLDSRFPLPSKCTIRSTCSDIIKAPDTFNGISLEAGNQYLIFGRYGNADNQPVIGFWGSDIPFNTLSTGSYYDSTTVSLQIADGQVRYEDSMGGASGWIPFAPAEGELLSWNFFSWHQGAQGRFNLRDVQVLCAPEPTAGVILLTALAAFGLGWRRK